MKRKHQHVWGPAEITRKGKCVALNGCIRKEESLKPMVQMATLRDNKKNSKYKLITVIIIVVIMEQKSMT